MDSRNPATLEMLKRRLHDFNPEVARTARDLLMESPEGREYLDGLHWADIDAGFDRMDRAIRHIRTAAIVCGVAALLLATVFVVTAFPAAIAEAQMMGAVEW